MAENITPLEEGLKANLPLQAEDSFSENIFQKEDIASEDAVSFRKIQFFQNRKTESSHSLLSQLLQFSEREETLKKDAVLEGGVICEISRLAFTVRGISKRVALGDNVLIDCQGQLARGEVIQVNEATVLVKPFNERVVASLNAGVYPIGSLHISPDVSWRGRVINALAQPIDGMGSLLQGKIPRAVESYAPPALRRKRVAESVPVGVNVIDIFMPICFGQRIGIFAGSGVGKSTLLAMMTKADHFDTVVLALTGERGREVRDMLDDTLQDKREKVVTVVSTGDESAMMRALAPLTATAVAEYFSALGHKVLLLVDSVTRYALAAREVALAAHEPPVARGFPPSVFSQLPRLLERAGPGIEGSGSITGIYTVLVDGDDHNDPIADSIRGILDGHIVLDRSIAGRGQFPAVDIMSSISRLAPQVWTKEQMTLVQNLKEMIARFEETRDLRAMGAYKAGADPLLDQALILVPRIYKALQQSMDTAVADDPYAALAASLRE